MKLIYVDSLGLKKLFKINNFFIKKYNSNKLLYNIILFLRYKKLNLSVQKNRSMVNFSKKKLRKQKGSGMARVGSRSSPIRISGGRSFPNKYIKKIFHKINKKTYNISKKLIIYYFILENKVYILEDIFIIKPCVKLIINILKNFNIINKNILFITNKINKNFYFSCKNLYNIRINCLNKLDIINMIKFKYILIFKSSLNYINFN